MNQPATIWRLMLVCAACAWYTLELGMTNIWPFLFDHLQLRSHPGSQAALILALSVSVAGPVSGAVSSRLRRDRLVPMIFGLTALSHLACALTSDLSLLAIARLLPLCLHPALFATVSRMVDEKGNAWVGAAALGGIALGLAGFWPLAAALSMYLSYQSLMLVCVGLELAAVGAYPLLVPQYKTDR